MKKYPKNMLVGSFIFSFIVTLIFSLFSLQTIRKINLISTSKEISQVVTVLSPRLSQKLPVKVNQDHWIQLHKISEIYHTKFAIYQLDGSPFYLPENSDLFPSFLTPTQRNDIINASKIPNKKFRSKTMLRSAFPIIQHNNIEGFFLIYQTLNPENFNNSILPKVLYLSIILFFLLLGISFAFYRSVQSPLKILTSRFKKISNGDLNVDLPPQHYKRFHSLIFSFNVMVSSIREQISRLTIEKKDLKTVFSVMTETLWIVDPENRIVFANTAFYKLTDSFPKKVENEFYWKFIRNTEIDNLIKKVRKLHKRTLTEIHQDQSTYLCTADFLPQEKKIILILNDISEIKQVESYKRHLVMNVSHELKTPLTSIKGFVETLLSEEENKEKLHYLQIIMRNTDRLSNIIRDLLLLSNLESSDEPLQIEKTNLSELIHNLIPLFEDKLHTKNIDLRLDLDPNVILPVDPFKIEQVLINLIQNAIHYTEKGFIEVTLRSETQKAVVFVKDTGIGIPPQKTDRIFERFYVIDQSRSRQVGGTGLGLSIVKHIIELHGGRIRVSSSPGKGSLFTFILPNNLSHH